jgi:septal ring factor EnvC (AmiA/AmiB activator)
MMQDIDSSVQAAIGKLTAQKDRLHSERESLLGKLADLEERLDQLNAAITSLNDIRSTIGAMPEEARRIIDEGTLDSAADEDDEARRKTHFDQIIAFLQSVGNKPQNVSTIAQKTNIQRSSVTAVLYRTHSGYFVKEQASDSPVVLWRFRTKADNEKSQAESFDPPGNDDIPF